MSYGERPDKYVEDRQQWERAAEGYLAVYDKDPVKKERKIEFDQRVKGWKQETPNFGDFTRETNGLPEAERKEAEEINAKIGADKELLARQKEKLEKKTKAGRVMETLVKELFQYNLKAEGYKFEVAPASEFDDVINGTDMVIRIEIINENETDPAKKSTFLYFSLDVTTNQNADDLDNKIFSAAKKLEDGILHYVDYLNLKSDEKAPKGRREMPHLVIGLSPDKVFSKEARPEELFQQYLEYIGDEKGKAETLEKSPVWREFFSQMKSQLVFHLEPCLRAYIHNHREEKNGLIDELSGHLRNLQSLSVDDEIDSRELKDFRQFLADNRSEISDKDPYYAHNLYQHIDLLEVVEKLDQEKSSQGIGFPRASTTESVLEMNGQEVKKDYRRQVA